MGENLVTSVIVEVEIPEYYTDKEAGSLADHFRSLPKFTSVRLRRPYVVAQVGELDEENIPGIDQALHLTYCALDNEEFEDAEVSGVFYGEMLPEGCPVIKSIRELH